MDEVEYLLHNFYLFILCQRLSSLRLASLTAKVRHSSILVKDLTFGNNTALVVILTERSPFGFTTKADASGVDLKVHYVQHDRDVIDDIYIITKFWTNSAT